MFSADRKTRRGGRATRPAAYALAGVLSAVLAGGAAAQSSFGFEGGGTFGEGAEAPAPVSPGGSSGGGGFVFEGGFGDDTPPASNTVPDAPPRQGGGFVFADDDFTAETTVVTPPPAGGEGGFTFENDFTTDGPPTVTVIPPANGDDEIPEDELVDITPEAGGFTPADDDFENLTDVGGGGTTPPPGGGGAGGGGGGSGPPADPRVVAFESQDFGVPQTDQLHQGAPHGPTPTRIPGGLVVETAVLSQAVAGGQALLVDVLGGATTIQGAIDAVGMGQPGSYQDQIQQQVVSFLAQATQNNPDAMLIFFCSDPMCWLSYNASLRAIAAGYRNVVWYRGGLAAWQMAGGQLVPR